MADASLATLRNRVLQKLKVLAGADTANAEDTALNTRVQEGMASRTFSMGPLSDKEVCLKSFCARIRDLIPEARLEQRPAPGWSHK